MKSESLHLWFQRSFREFKAASLKCPLQISKALATKSVNVQKRLIATFHELENLADLLKPSLSQRTLSTRAEF
jgi:hypothetical protein